MARERIWTGLDLTVQVFQVDSKGVRINANGNPWVESDGPLLTYCFFQRAEVFASLPITRRAVTGRRFKRLGATQYEYEMNVDSFYAHKDTDLNQMDIFNRDKYLELVMTYENPADATDKDVHTMSICKGEWRVTSEENGNAAGSAHFSGERFS